MANTTVTATTALFDHTNTGEVLVVLAWTLFSFSTVVVCLRFWARTCRVLHVSIDDYLMAISLLCCAMHSILVTVAYSYGIGQHSDTLDPSNLLQAKKYTVACEAFAIITCMFGRLSFCAFFLILIGPTNKHQRTITWVIIVAQVVGNTIIVIQVYAQCGKHVSALWDPVVAATASCEKPKAEMIFNYIQAAINCLSDFVLTFLPGYLLWNLQIPRRTKIGLSTVLMLSIFALAASIVKAVSIENLNTREDFTRNMATLEIWCAVENNIVIITASIPTLLPLFKKSQHTSISTPKSSNSLTTHAQSHDRELDVELQAVSLGCKRQHTFSTAVSERDSEGSDPPSIDEIVITRTMQIKFSFEEWGRPSSLERVMKFTNITFPEP